MSINVYCTIHFTSCSYCHPKNHTRVHHLNIYHYSKFFSRVVRYTVISNVFVLCHRTIAVLYVLHHFVIIAFPIALASMSSQ